MITVELFGVARLRAGVDSIELGQAKSLGEAFKMLGQRLPDLMPQVIEHGRLQPYYAAAVNGVIVAKGLDMALSPGDVLMILSADAGG